MEVLDVLAHALLEVGGSDDLQVLAQRQPRFALRAVGRLHDELEEVDAALEAAGDDDLALPGVGVFGHDVADGVVALPVAAQRLQRRRDVMRLEGNAEMPRQQLAAARAVAAGIALWQQQAVDALRPQRAHRQRCAH